MAIPTYIGQIASFHSSNVSRAVPAGTQVGDLAILIGQSDIGAVDLDTTSGPNEAGWTEITSLLVPDRKTNGNVQYVDVGIKMWWRVLASTSNIPFLAAGNCMTIVTVLRGFTAAPTAVACVAQNNSQTGISFPDLISGANSLILHIHKSGRNTVTAQFSTFANAGLANVTQRLSVGNAAGYQVGIVTGEKSAEGAIGVGTAVLANANKQLNIVMAFGDAPPAPVTGPPKGASYTTDLRRRRRE